MKIGRRSPECDEDVIYTTQVSASGGYGPDLLPDVGGFLGLSKKFDLYICGNCGYT